MVRAIPTCRPHVHVEDDEVRGSDAANGDVAETVDGVEGTRDAAQPTSHGLEDTVWLRGCTVGVERKTQSAGEGGLRDLLCDVLALTGVGVDHDTHGATGEDETPQRPLPACQQVGKEEEALWTRGEWWVWSERRLRDDREVRAGGVGRREGGDVVTAFVVLQSVVLANRTVRGGHRQHFLPYVEQDVVVCGSRTIVSTMARIGTLLLFP